MDDLPQLRTLDLVMCDGMKMVPAWFIGDAWRMDALDLSRRIKKRKSINADSRTMEE